MDCVLRHVIHFNCSRVYDRRVHHYYIILNKMEIVIYITIFLYTIKYIIYIVYNTNVNV
jgi:hypothetical protein